MFVFFYILADVNIIMDQKWNIIEKNGKDYINITDFKLKMTNGQAYFKLENLFNGDKTLGKLIIVVNPCYL